MRGSTHALTGAVIALALSSSPDTAQSTVIAAAGAIGALLPDLDHPRATLSRRAGLLALPFRLLSHRGITHSAVAAALVTVGALLMPAHLQPVAISAAAGYLSHIALDACTLSGVPLFWPSHWRFRLLPLRTGGIVEQLGAAGLLGLLVAFTMRIVQS